MSPHERASARGVDSRRWYLPQEPGRAAIAGVVSFLVGYAVTGIAFTIEMQSASGGGSGADGLLASIVDQAVGIGSRQIVATSGGELLLALRAIGWTFFSAQQIPLSGTVSGLGVTATGTVDVLSLARTSADVALTPALYYIVPPICLVLAGWWFARTRRPSTPWAGAGVGAQIAFGYLPFVLVGSLLFALSASVSFLVASARITAEPVVLRAAFFGAGYAVVFGALGGALAAKVPQN